jgi:ABC-type enterochelin transport system substrate-binding protein
MLNAIIKKYEAQIAEAEATIDIYLNNSVGIGEHPQHIEELDKLFGKIAEAEDKLKIVERWED